MSEHVGDQEDRSATSGTAEAARDAVDEERIQTAGIPESIAETERAEGRHSVEEERQAGTASGGPGGDRFQQLLDKRHEAGLSNEEANELGRLMAEREGQQYSNAATSKHDPAESGPPG